MKADPRSDAELVQWGVELARKERRWPLVVDAGSDATYRRRFGSWSKFKRRVQEAYCEKHGTPEWDYVYEPVRNRNQILRAEVVEMVEQAIERLGALKPYTPRLPKRDAEKDPAEIHAIISDVHVGEYNDPRLTGGLAGYSFDGFLEAADRHEERLMFFTELYRKAWTIDKLVVNFLGDIVTGEAIFQGQALQIDRILTDQIFEAAHRFACMFRNWAARFRKVEIFAVAGNHGRIGKPGELHWRSNADYIAYKVVKVLLRDVKNIRTFIADGPTLIVEHGPTNWLVHHGDSIRGAGATNGSVIGHERKMRAWADMGSVPIHYSVSGHFHRGTAVQTAGGGTIYSNGSYPGGNEYSVERLNACHVPSQKMLLFDPKHGRTHSETDLYLGERRQLVPDENRILTRNYEA